MITTSLAISVNYSVSTDTDIMNINKLDWLAEQKTSWTK